MLLLFLLRKCSKMKRIQSWWSCQICPIHEDVLSFPIRNRRHKRLPSSFHLFFSAIANCNILQKWDFLRVILSTCFERKNLIWANRVKLSLKYMFWYDIINCFSLLWQFFYENKVLPKKCVKNKYAFSHSSWFPEIFKSDLL